MDKKIFFGSLPDKSNVSEKSRETVHSHAYEILRTRKNEVENNDKMDYFDVKNINNNSNEGKLDFKKHFEFKKPLSTIESLTNYSIKDLGTASPPPSPHKENSISSDYNSINYNLNYIEINKENLNKLFSTPKLDKNSPSKEEDTEKKLSSSRLDSSNPNERYSEMVMALNDPNSKFPEDPVGFENNEFPEQKSMISEDKGTKFLERVKTAKLFYNKNTPNEFPDKKNSANVALIRQINKIETNKSLPASGRHDKVMKNSPTVENQNKVLLNNYTLSDSDEKEINESITNLNSASREKTNKSEQVVKQKSLINLQSTNHDDTKEQEPLNLDSKDLDFVSSPLNQRITSNEITFINSLDTNSENMNFSNENFFSKDNQKTNPEEIDKISNRESIKSIKNDLSEKNRENKDFLNKNSKHQEYSTKKLENENSQDLNEPLTKIDFNETVDPNSERERLIREKWDAIENNPFLNVKPRLHHSSRENFSENENNENEDKIEKSFQKNLNEKNKSKNSNKKIKNKKKRNLSIGSHGDSLLTADSSFESDSETDEDSKHATDKNPEEFKFKSDNYNLDSEWNGFLKELETFDYEKLLKEYEMKNNLKVNSEDFKTFLVNTDSKDLL